MPLASEWSHQAWIQGLLPLREPFSLTLPGVLAAVQEQGPSQHPAPLPHASSGANPCF